MNYDYFFQKKLTSNNNSDMKNILKLRDELCNYNMFDFLTKVSALMLIPQNQSKSVIFQCMISTALSIPNEDINFNCKMSSGKFKYFVNEFSKLNRREMIDPPEFPFYLPVMYYGNYNVFMGANSLSPVYLNQILKILSVHKDNINDSEYEELNYIVRGLLKLSDDIVKQLNVQFENIKSYNKDIEIFVPPSHVLNIYSEIVQFSLEKINHLFGKFYGSLLINFGDITEDEILDFVNQKFYKKPLVKYKDMYLITDVTTIIGLVMYRIIDVFRDNKEFNIFDEYNQLLSFELEKCFTRFAVHKLNPTAFELELIDDSLTKESIYLGGNDIIFYNLILLDDGKDYNNQNYILDKSNNYLSDRIKYVKRNLIKYGADENKIVTIITPTTNGRNMFYKLNVKSEENLLTLSLYELHAISVNETDDSMFLFRYIKARNLLYKYRKNLFSELNIVALYVQNDYSFYINDDFDTKNRLLYLIGEYSSDYILKAYITEGLHLAKYKNNGSLIEVMRLDDTTYFAPGLFFEKQMNALIEFENFNLWILSEKEITSNTYFSNKTIIDMLVYWLSQLDDIFNNLYGVFYINIKCDVELSNVGYKKSDIDNKIKVNIENNNLIIHLEKYALLNFETKDNLKEKEFISIIINNICNYYGIKFESKCIEKVFENKYKQKIITIDSLKEPYMLPFENPETIKVNNSDINLILDEVGNFVKKDLRTDYGKIEDYKILNNIVGYLYNDLQKRIKKYSKEELLKFIYLEYEKNLTSLHVRQSNYANDLVCYSNRKKDIDENYNMLNRTSVAMKFLIELIASTKFNGENGVSLYDIEYCLSIASQIIDYAYTCDAFNYKMCENSLVLLKSNRIGYNHDLINRVSVSLQKAKTGKMSPAGKSKREKIFEYDKSIRGDIPGFEEAFYEEFNFNFSDFTEVTVSMLEMAEKQNPLLNDVFQLEFDEIIKYINNKLDEKMIRKIISHLSLQEREDFLKPPENYRKEDVYPWRNNRELSLNRKPLIIYENKIIFGYRTLISSVYFLFDLINNATLKAHSKKMKNYISKISEKRGNDFNDLVYNYLCSFEHLIVDKKVSKINGKKIVDDKNNDLGDIDVLYISTKKRTITIGEVKNFELSRNMYEIYNEYLKMFDFDNNKSFYNKHMRRVTWCKNNIDDIINHYNLKKTKWKIDYCFIVNNPLVSNKALKINIKTYTIEELDKHL